MMLNKMVKSSFGNEICQTTRKTCTDFQNSNDDWIKLKSTWIETKQKNELVKVI